jgi:DNA-binding transcriptional MerR regulator
MPMPGKNDDTTISLIPQDFEALHPIPDKLYFRIGEVCGFTGVAAHVLRFWESEFPQLNPGRTEAGQRLYSRSDIEQILKIKYLLYNKKFTLKGARKYLKSRQKSKENSDFLTEITTELMAIRDLLK